ncbi:hypothetical protein DYB32_004917 [Aphanomyces invadans]|uniref:Uncharacterized protein n=1 Tax=Aphanomyces invadans TaxID=157072 RepID=A0A418B067_9STRA|nr:hypothetical protein DYB32_004917 [Aphanomyces invadans]
MRVMSCEKRHADEDAMAASALDRLAEMSDRMKRFKRSPIASVDAHHNMVTFSQYYDDDFHSESESDGGSDDDHGNQPVVSDYSTGKDVDSEESPPIEIEIQDIRVTPGGSSAGTGRGARRNGKPSKRKVSVQLNSLHGAPSKRLAQGLHDLSQCVTALLRDNGANGDYAGPTLNSIQSDPSDAVDNMSVSLTAFRHIVDSIRSTASNELMPIVRPSMEQLWETAQKLSRHEARMNLACWRNAAAEWRVKLQDALATPNPTSSCDGSHHALIEQCLDFVSSVSLCNLVRDESTDIRKLAIQESSDQLCRGIHQHNAQRFEFLATEARDLANAMRREADHDQGTASYPFVLSISFSRRSIATIVSCPCVDPPYEARTRRHIRWMHRLR